MVARNVLLYGGAQNCQRETADIQLPVFVNILHFVRNEAKLQQKMEIVQQLINFLPQYEEIHDILQNNAEAKYMLKRTLDTLMGYSSMSKNNLENEMEECSFLVQALVDKCWEEIHTGHFSAVPLETRKTYALGCYCKILFLLTESMEKMQLEKCSEILDEAILIGCTQNVFVNGGKFKDTLTEFFNSELDLVSSMHLMLFLICKSYFNQHFLLSLDPSEEFQLPTLDVVPRRPIKCDIPQLDCPSVQEFTDKCFKPQAPGLLLNTINHWPALEKWRNLNYLLKLAGNRTVPIEIGSNYATDDWSQQLMKIKEFLKRQFSNQTSISKDTIDIEYLAQHELFEQIPQLKNDFSLPDYCSLGVHKEAVDIKAWLGPQGTISPMHYDPKHNILCQVFGSKHIILASPKDSDNLYPHEGEFLSNTSQIDAAKLDLEKFPCLSEVTFYHLTLQPGDCLYMPPKWWHYVTSESPSFSVSFWWE